MGLGKPGDGGPEGNPGKRELLGPSSPGSGGYFLPTCPPPPPALTHLLDFENLLIWRIVGGMWTLFPVTGLLARRLSEIECVELLPGDLN